jgi:hypothetical protein
MQDLLSLVGFVAVTYLVWVAVSSKIHSKTKSKYSRAPSPLKRWHDSSIYNDSYGASVQVDESTVNEFGHGHRCFYRGLTESERRVVDVLVHSLSHKQYFIFNNIILPSDVTSSSQIDHVVVSAFGVFVIETKECNGWVFGDESSEQWTLTYQGGAKYPLRNPLKQNYGHIRALRGLLKFVGNNYHSLVVFEGDCEFKTPRIKNVLYLDELVEYIKSKNTIVLDVESLLHTIGELAYLCQSVEITYRDHVTNVKSLIEAKP